MTRTTNNKTMMYKATSSFARQIWKQELSEKLSDRQSLVIFGFLAALLCLFRIIALSFSKADLFFDEAQYWSWSQELDFGYFSKPPMLAWLIRGMTETCGSSEFCIRLLSPLLHSLTSVFIFLSARRLYNATTALWSGLAFLTLPAVSLSANLISTDVPLLLFWSMALWALIGMIQGRTKLWALALGLALGLGLLSKYAMIYFLICFGLLCLIAPEVRKLLKDLRLWLALLLSFLLIVPNILWNMKNQFATFSHTAANANWGSSFLHPVKALEFFGAQFAVFGPVLLTAFCIILWRWFATTKTHPEKNNKDQAETASFHCATRLLICYSAPILVIILVQAFVSRAHANWAATAYPAATLLVVATMLADRARIAFYASFILHAGLAIALAIGMGLAGHISFPGSLDPFSRVLGWRVSASVTHQKLLELGLHQVLSDDRGLTAELLYYLKDTKVDIRAWRAGETTRDHYQLTRPLKPEPATNALTQGQIKDKDVLLVSLTENPEPILSRFSKGLAVGSERIATGPSKVRTLYFYRLSGLKSP